MFSRIKEYFKFCCARSRNKETKDMYYTDNITYYYNI